MQKTWYEILEAVGNKKTKQEKIALLKKHSGPSLKTILGYTFDPNVKWLIPEGVPPYKPLFEGSDVEGRLDYELRKLHYFVEGPTEDQRTLRQAKREEMFITLLESVDARDAKLLLAMKERKLPFKGVTRNLVAEAFPNLAKNW